MAARSRWVLAAALVYPAGAALAQPAIRDVRLGAETLPCYELPHRREHRLGEQAGHLRFRPVAARGRQGGDEPGAHLAAVEQHPQHRAQWERRRPLRPRQRLKDGITVDRLSLPCYATGNRPRLRCLGLVGKGLALLWLQNTDHTFAALLDKRPQEPVSGARVTLSGIPAGPCRIEWWDTTTGEVTRTTEERAGKDGLVLDAPPLATDVAVKVRW